MLIYLMLVAILIHIKIIMMLYKKPSDYLSLLIY